LSGWNYKEWYQPDNHVFAQKYSFSYMWTAGHIRRWITLQVCSSRIRRHICWWSQELRQVMLRLLVEDDSMIWCGLDNYILWRQKKSFPAHACVIVLSQKLERQKFDILNMQICDTEGGSNQLHFLVWDKVATVLCFVYNYEHVMSGKHSSKHYDLDIWQNLQAKQKWSIYFTNTKAEDCVNIDYFRSNNIIFMIFFSNS